MADVPFVDERYQLLDLVGRGAIATVWKALDRETGDTVAIKLMRTTQMVPELVQRLAQEVEILRRLQHPGIVRVVGAGVAAHEGNPYMVLEWLEGVTLRQQLVESPRLDTPVILRIVKQVAAALTSAHDQDVVHRDLKPENVVLVGPDRAIVKIVDFGMAKLPAIVARLVTLRSTLFGTPQYMAPERALAKAVTPATDVYALGVIAYEMIAGRRPFDGDEPRTILRMHVNAPVPPVPDAPAAVEAVLLSALAKDPTHRPKAEGFYNGLKRAYSGHPTAL